MSGIHLHHTSGSHRVLVGGNVAGQSEHATAGCVPMNDQGVNRQSNVLALFLKHVFPIQNLGSIVPLKNLSSVLQNVPDFPEHTFSALRLTNKNSRDILDATVGSVTRGLNHSEANSDFERLIQFIRRSWALRSVNTPVQNDEQIIRLVNELKQSKINYTGDFSLSIQLPEGNSLVTMKGLAALSRLNILSHLNIKHFQLNHDAHKEISPETLVKEWAKLPNLKSLSLDCNQIFVRNNIEQNLEQSRIYTRFLLALNQLTNLHVLHLNHFLRYSFDNQEGSDIFMSLNTLVNLEELVVAFNQDENCQQHDIGYVSNQSVDVLLYSCQKLKKLRFELPTYFDEQAEVEGNHYQDIGRAILQAPNIEHLEVEVCYWTNESLAIPRALVAQGNHHALQHLVLRSTNRPPMAFIDFDEFVISDSTLGIMGNFSALKSFTVQGCLFTSEGLCQLIQNWPEKMEQLKIESGSLQLDQSFEDMNDEYPVFESDFLIQKTPDGFLFKYSQCDESVHGLIDLIVQRYAGFGVSINHAEPSGDVIETTIRFNQH